MKFVLFLFFTLLSTGSVNAKDYYTSKKCNVQQKRSMFYYVQGESLNPEKVYNSFVIDFFEERMSNMHMMLNCFSIKEEQLSAKCLDIKEGLREFTTENFSAMKVSLMIYKNSSRVSHLNGNGDILTTTKPQIEKFLKEKSRYHITSAELRYRRGVGIPKNYNNQSELKEKKTIDERELLRIQSKEKHFRKYLRIVRTWPFFKHIESIENLNTEKLNLVILDALSKQYYSMEIAINSIKSSNAKFHDFIYSRSVIELFLKKQKKLDSFICDFVEDLYEKESEKDQTSFLLRSVVPLITGVGSCFIFTPVGCAVINISIGAAATVYDYQTITSKVQKEIVLINSKMGSGRHLQKLKTEQDFVIYLSPLVLIESFFVVKAFKNLR